MEQAVFLRFVRFLFGIYGDLLRLVLRFYYGSAGRGLSLVRRLLLDSNQAV